MELPGYQFFCHSQIRTELYRHNVSGSMEWLKNKISTGQIKCYGDEDILDELEPVYGARCISVLSAFIRLKKECDFGQEEAKDYIKSWNKFCAEHKQTTFKVQANSQVLRMCKVPCGQVMREIYEDKLEETRMGYLRYKA